MPSRKQRKRRQKERRHDYEVVYVDDEGNEVEAPPQVEPKRDRNGGKKAAKGGGAKDNRPVREAKPPSWQRSGKRALLFFPLFFIVFSLVNKGASVEARLIASLGYSALFVPLTYMMDRTAYRTFLRRSGRG